MRVQGEGQEGLLQGHREVRKFKSGWCKQDWLLCAQSAGSDQSRFHLLKGTWSQGPNLRCGLGQSVLGQPWIFQAGILREVEVILETQSLQI